MGHVIYCLMCLETGVKMYPMNFMLTMIYNKLILIPDNKYMIQMYACYECAYLLLKYERFKKSCWKSYNMLCKLTPEPFKVTEECLNRIDGKLNKSLTMLTSSTLNYDYQPEQDKCASNKEFNIEEVITYPITLNNKYPNDEDNQLQRAPNIRTTTTHNGIITPDCYSDDDYQLLDVKSTSEVDFEIDYQLLEVTSTSDYDTEDNRDQSGMKSTLVDVMEEDDQLLDKSTTEHNIEDNDQLLDNESTSQPDINNDYQLLDVTSSSELDNEDDYQVLEVKSTSEHDTEDNNLLLNVKKTQNQNVVDDYQFLEVNSTSENDTDDNNLLIDVKSTSDHDSDYNNQQSNMKSKPKHVAEGDIQLSDVNCTPSNKIEIGHEQKDVKYSLKHNIDNDYQLSDVRSTPERDIENDYKCNYTFKVESTTCDSNTGCMLWLSIESKENTEVVSDKPQVQTPIQKKREISNINKIKTKKRTLDAGIKAIEEKRTNTVGKPQLKLLSYMDKKQIKKNLSRKNETISYDVSEIDISGSLLSLDSEVFKDHVTVTEMSPEHARREFQARKKSVNYIRNPHKCDLCYRGFLSKASYESHLKKHSLKYGAFRCDICKLCYIDQSYLTKHRLRMHRRKFSCKICPYVCFAQTQCTAHILSHRGMKYTCRECGMAYRFRNSLLSHINIKHSGECVCDICGSTFISETGLSYHKHLAHRQEKNEYLGPKCNECDIHFASKLAWKRHRVLCSRHKVKFGCKVCGEEFENSDNLKTHSRKHGTTKYSTPRKYFQHVCVFCKIALPDKSSLNNHLNTNHPTEVSGNLMKTLNEDQVCEICGKVFLERCLLVSHQKIHSDEVRYSCPDCGMRTKYKEYLAVHRRAHSGEYNDRFQCDLCGRPFSDKGRLVRHMKGHMGIRPHKCGACDKTFQFRCDMRNHYKHVHDKQPYPKKDKNKKSRRQGSRGKIEIFHNL